MRSLSIIALEIYQKLGKQFPNLTERREATKQYILKEITQWNVKKTTSDNFKAYKPSEFQGTEQSPPFEVRLLRDTEDNTWELKFGNLNAETDKERFKWDDKDSMKLPKALFLYKVLETEVIPFIKQNNQVKFTPYDEDGLGDERYSYFYNMFTKLNKNKEYSLTQKEDTYYINNKQK